MKVYILCSMGYEGIDDIVQVYSNKDEAEKHRCELFRKDFMKGRKRFGFKWFQSYCRKHKYNYLVFEQEVRDAYEVC